ncbi:MAG TPA: helix-hairpin-helix domain-containing protein [Cyclobacteriaceae bacterium]|nr:helix-hairpin-helix domain-containing protein [Cyclobacteriaceae bacterium]
MHRIRIWIRGFFGFSRKETNAFLILLPLMMVILVSEPVYRRWKFRNDDFNFFDQHYTDSVLASLTYTTKDSSTRIQRIEKEIHFTAFDPNTISEKDLTAFGMSPFVASRIVRYREKGGTFKKKEDLLRIYGVDSSWFRKASAWMRFQERKVQASERKAFEKRVTKTELIDINIADSVQLVNIFGIGPALSRRIRNYRDKLGGYVSMEQLREVYGLDTLALNEIKKRFILTTEFVPRRIDINKVTIEELVRHPYIKRREAQAIVNYRNQHGVFASVDDLLKVQVVDKAWLERVRPYMQAGVLNAVDSQ